LDNFLLIKILISFFILQQVCLKALVLWKSGRHKEKPFLMMMVEEKFKELEQCKFLEWHQLQEIIPLTPICILDTAVCANILEILS